MSSGASAAQVLPSSVGWGMVCGIGLFFSVLMIGISKLQGRYTSINAGNSEEFNSASRSVKPGLIATGIVSAWTWAATLLQSSAVAYKFGISGPFWYAGGATVQVLLFAQLAAKLKLNAPYAHTFTEIIACRWPGKAAHATFLFFAIVCNIIVSSMLVTGGSATVHSLTGVPVVASCFLIPVGVALYVVVGGMRATLISDYLHTTILFSLLLTFMFTVYSTSSQIGSPKRMHDLLSEVSRLSPVKNNQDGSYLTMRSTGGLIFGVMNIIGNFGTVFCDQAYWQRAIASTPQTAVKAYLLGGLAWFSIPFGLATTLGLAAVALGVKLSPSEIGDGLPAPVAAAALMGKGGAGAMLLLLFLAVTSATSAELVAVSSISTFDIYKCYINPRATDDQVLRWSHSSVVAFSLVMGVLGTIFYHIGVSMGFLYELMGTLIGCAVVPVAISITWRKANKWGCICGAISGLCLGLMTWIVAAAKLNDGLINIDTLFQDYPMLSGNLVSISVGGIVSMTWSLLSPEDFDFDITRALNFKSCSTVTEAEGTEPPLEQEDKKATSVEEPSPDEAKIYIDENIARVDIPEIDYTGLQRAFSFAAIASITLAIIILIIIPLPLFFSKHVFSSASFTVWVVVSMIWAWMGALIVVGLPLWESRRGLGKVATGIYKDIFQRGTGAYVRN